MASCACPSSITKVVGPSERLDLAVRGVRSAEATGKIDRHPGRFLERITSGARR
jgi:hypothetical protein